MVELHMRAVLVRAIVFAGACALADAPACAAPYVAPLSARACVSTVMTQGGRLRECELSEPARVQKHDFPRGARVVFRIDGTLEHAVYVEASGFMIHGEAWRDTATVDYDRSGRETAKYVERWQSTVRHDPVPRNFR